MNNNQNQLNLNQNINILENIPEAIRNQSIEELRIEVARNHQLVNNQIETNSIREILINEGESLQLISEQYQENEIFINQIYERTEEQINTIINQNGIWDYLFRFINLIQELPIYQKLILSGSLIILISGGLYISFKIIKRINKPLTIITPFGTNKKLSVIGRLIKAIIYKN